MNYVILGIIAILIAAIFAIIWWPSKKETKKSKMSPEEVLEASEKLIEGMPPVTGPTPAPEPDFDNPYSIRANEPLVVADHEELDELEKKADILTSTCPQENTTDIVIKSFGQVVAEAPVGKVKKTRGKKAGTKKSVEKKVSKKDEKKAKTETTAKGGKKAKAVKNTKKTKKETK